MSDDLPTPPLRLRRVHLYGVGPEGARFDPLDLDFVADGGAAARVLLSLTNTGGKSTLITLVTSLIVPASRAQMGGKQLGDYVLTGDTAHVVCEWEDDATGVRTITGTVMEWQDGRRQPGYKQRSTTNMHRGWYLFRTRPDFPGIDDLPFLDGEGRRSTYLGFMAAVRELLAPHPAAQWVVVDKQHEWTEALEKQTSIDPVLIGYQMRMNDSEAGAEKLLESFNSPDNVVRFFVAALNDERQLSDFTGKLKTYAELAGDRPRLEALRAFCEEAEVRVQRVAECEQVFTQAQQAELRTRTAGGQHAAALQNRVEKDRQRLAELAVHKEQAQATFQELRREYNQISDIRMQLQLEAAHAAVAEADSAENECRQVEQERQFEARAWEAVRPVLDVAGARARVATTQQAYDAAERDMAPLRRLADEAAAALAARLEALAAEARSNVEQARTRAEEAANERHRTQDRVKEADRRAETARRRLEQLEATVRAGDAAWEQAVSDGWISGGEWVRECVARWIEKRDATRDEEYEASRAAAQSQDEFDRAVHDIDRLAEELVELREQAQTCRGRLDAFDRDLAELAEDEVLVNLLGAAPEDVASVQRAAELAKRGADESDQRAARYQQLADAANDEVAHLDETGTAPAGPDTVAVLKVLNEARIGAVTGLQWIEKNVSDPEVRADYIAAHPDLAGGVVVSDASRFGEVTALLTDHAPRTRTAVTVTVAGEHGARPRDPEPSYVVVPHRATWDQEWAARVREELQRSAVHDGEQAGNARDAARRHRKCAAACGSFAGRWDGTSRDTLRAGADDADEVVRARDVRRAERVGDRQRHRDQADAAHKTRESAQQRAVDAERMVAKAEELRKLVDDAERARSEKPDQERALTQAKSDVDDADRAAQEADRLRDAYTQQAAEQNAHREQLLDQRAEIGAESAAEDPGGSLEQARTAWATARNKRDDAERGMSEAADLDRAKEDLARLENRRDQHGPQELQRAEALCATASASSAALLDGEVSRAKEFARDAQRKLLQANNAAEQARKHLDNQRPINRQNHVDLSRTPEWEPATPADIPAVHNRLDAYGDDLRNRRDEAENETQQAQQLHDEVAGDIDFFGDTITMWTAERSPTPDSFSGTRESARSRMTALHREHAEKNQELSAARDGLRDAVSNAHAVAADVRWKHLDDRAAVRLRELSAPDLIAEAQVLAKRIRDKGSTAAGDLQEMDTHRTILRDDLVGLCRDQRRLLREITNNSKLPAGLGNLTDQPAIQIRFDTAPDDESAARLADRVDSWARELAEHPQRANSVDVRTRWLADAVRDTVVPRPRAGPWSIEILKPSIDGKVVHCPPDRIPHEFSGGQVLTLAVLVYCALSRVRASHRVGGPRPPGPLILDNPFGSASAETLIAMQHRLAACSGLQMVCATGLHDVGVDAAFTGPGSVIVKLRNDGDQRRNLSFLRLRASVVDGVDVPREITGGRDRSAAANWVDALRYQVRR